MEEGEGIVSYFQKVDSVVNEIKDIGGVLDEKDVIQKITRTLPESYSDKISVIEETYDPTKFTREQLFDTLTAFETRKFGRDKAKPETTFKASKVADEDSDDESLDEMEENFMRKLKRGTDKYKGMLPLKCFKCGNIGHYESRCLERGSKQKFNDNKGKFNKKTYYVKDDASISDDELDYEDGDCLLMVEKDRPKSNNSKIVETVALALHFSRDINEWLIDSGYSNHMITKLCL